ncbi:MAG TPA: hypothetical protein VFO39_02100 [Candidatus Sulfotelmatobacter sp.]|nr:hypothetical protein [Candidatus Sulfotelmatobacter sp.]
MKTFRPTTLPLPLRYLLMALAAVPLFATIPIQAQEEEPLHLDITTADSLAATYSVSHLRTHMMAASTKAGRTIFSGQGLSSPAFVPRAVSKTTTTASTALTVVPAPGFYGEDLVFFGGQVVKTAKVHPLYMNVSSCGTVATCFGNPVQFINDLSNSTFMHITDQYVGVTTANRYPAGTAASASVPLLVSNVLGQADILAAVHTAAKTLGTGYGHIYHVFLPSGVDTCFDLTSICYSPDSPPSFLFCAYHASVTFSDIGHVLFTVIPFQNVQFCNSAPPNPNSSLIDSTNSVLSHEEIETITDPDGTGWISDSSPAVAGFEIGDLCQGFDNGNGNIVPTLTLNGRKYELQLEYGNDFHACSATP